MGNLPAQVQLRHPETGSLLNTYLSVDRSGICFTDLRITVVDGWQNIIMHAETVNCLFFVLQGFC